MIFFLRGLGLHVFNKVTLKVFKPVSTSAANTSFLRRLRNHLPKLNVCDALARSRRCEAISLHSAQPPRRLSVSSPPSRNARRYWRSGAILTAAWLSCCLTCGVFSLKLSVLEGKGLSGLGTGSWCVEGREEFPPCDSESRARKQKFPCRKELAVTCSVSEPYVRGASAPGSYLWVRVRGVGL